MCEPPLTRDARVGEMCTALALVELCVGLESLEPGDGIDRTRGVTAAV